MAESAWANVSDFGDLEIVARFDDDDLESAKEAEKCDVKVIIGPRRQMMTIYWNECFEACHGDIVQQANDDMIFMTNHWNALVENAFAEVPDKILLVHGRDVLGHQGDFGPHPFISRRWVEALGYFIPPYFCSDFGDAWINELADRIGRRRFVPFDIEHRHFSHGFPEMEDETTKERLARHGEDDPDSLYYSPEMTAERVRDAEKLAKLMDSAVDTHGWTPPKTPGVLSMGKCPKCGSIMTVPYDGKVACNACGLVFERVRK